MRRLTRDELTTLLIHRLSKITPPKFRLVNEALANEITTALTYKPPKPMPKTFRVVRIVDGKREYIKRVKRVSAVNPKIKPVATWNTNLDDHIKERFRP
jgi:hypothetical protein